MVQTSLGKTSPSLSTRELIRFVGTSPSPTTKWPRPTRRHLRWSSLALTLRLTLVLQTELTSSSKMTTVSCSWSRLIFIVLVLEWNSSLGIRLGSALSRLLICLIELLWCPRFPVGAVIGFEETEYTVSENGGSVPVVVSVLEGELSEDVTIVFSTEDGTATRTCMCNHYTRVTLFFSSPKLTKYLLQSRYSSSRLHCDDTNAGVWSWEHRTNHCRPNLQRPGPRRRWELFRQSRPLEESRWFGRERGAVSDRNNHHRLWRWWANRDSLIAS